MPNTGRMLKFLHFLLRSGEYLPGTNRLRFLLLDLAITSIMMILTTMVMSIRPVADALPEPHPGMASPL